MQHSLTIAICLATFNGGNYLSEQLDTLENQTRPPDLLLISDDGSTDNTASIIGDFMSRTKLNVKLVQRARDDGFRGNFNAAANGCDCDVIVFCDQDDLWDPAKLKLIEENFSQNDIFAVAHSYVDFELRSSVVWERHHILPHLVLDGLLLAPLFIWPGMAIAVRRSVIDTANQLEREWEEVFNRVIYERPDTLNDHWSHMHDVLYLTTARLLGRVVLVSDIIARHRIHSTNYSQKKDTWKQPSELQMKWGSAPYVAYKATGYFCRDMKAMLLSRDWPNMEEIRRNHAAAFYERWAVICSERYHLHLREKGSSSATKLLNLIRIGAYASKWNGGLGYRSFFKDLICVLGVRIW